MDKEDQVPSEVGIKGKPERKLSRRSFLKLAVPAAAGYLVDRVVFGGTFSDLFWGFITNPQIREKVLGKLQNLDETVKEIQQQVGDRKATRDKVELGEKESVSEEWMKSFSQLEIFRLKGELHKDQTVFFADLPSLEIQANPYERKANLTLYSDPETFLKKDSVILPGFQIGTKTATNAYVPSYYSVLGTDRGTLEFLDFRDATNNPRDGAIIIDMMGKPRFVPRDEVKDYSVSGSRYFDSSKIRVKGILTVPTSVEVDLSLPPEDFFRQVSLQLEKINNNVLFSQDISHSKRFETFYLQVDDKFLLMGICKTDSSRAWIPDQRLSIYQAVGLGVEYARRNGAKKVAVIPTDPDLNDAVLKVAEGREWKKVSLTNKDQGEDLLRQPFYISFKK